MRGLLLLSFILSTTLGFTQAVKKEVTGIVRSRILADENNNAIPGVVVKSADGKKLGKTDTYGQFSFKFEMDESNPPSFNFSRKEYKSKTELYRKNGNGEFIVYLDCEDDKYLREATVTVKNESGNSLSDVVVNHSYYLKADKTDDKGQFILRAPNTFYLESYEKSGAENITVTLVKEGYEDYTILSKYEDLKEDLNVIMKKKAQPILLVMKNEKGEIEKHKFVNLESLKDYVIDLKDKSPLKANIISNAIDINPDATEFDIVKDQDKAYELELMDELGRLKKYQFVNLDAIEEFVLNLSETNPDLANQIRAKMAEDPSLAVLSIPTKAVVAQEEKPESQEEEQAETKVEVKKEKVFAAGETLATIQHDFDKYRNAKEFNAIIDELVATLKSSPSTKVVVESHTDSKGEEDYNLALSKKRAESVKKTLIRKGINSNRITISYYGETKPIAANENSDGSDNEAGRAKNRRTEVKVIG